MLKFKYWVWNIQRHLLTSCFLPLKIGKLIQLWQKENHQTSKWLFMPFAIQTLKQKTEFHERVTMTLGKETFVNNILCAQQV